MVVLPNFFSPILVDTIPLISSPLVHDISICDKEGSQVYLETRKATTFFRTGYCPAGRQSHFFFPGNSSNFEQFGQWVLNMPFHSNKVNCHRLF